jgi:glycosyltransferase involved in cell wall biosynthesis
MRIIQLVAQSRIGGAESVGFTLAAEFAQRGHRTLLLSNRDNGPLLARERPAGMDALALNRSSRLDPRIVTFLERAVRSFRPDVIHAHNYEASTWARALGLLHRRMAVVVHVHSSRFVHNHGRHRVLADRLLFRRADAVIALNETQAGFLRETIRLDLRKLFLVTNGIDTKRFAPPGTPTAPPGPPETPTAKPSTGQAPTRWRERLPGGVVCVASLTQVKNHTGLLRAWATVAKSRPQARLTLVGDGPLRATLEGQARESGIGDSVIFAGASDDVRPFLWEAAVFALPSHLEAVPLSLLEAMAAGCAPVATRVGGIPGVVDDCLTGLLVPPGDNAVLAAALGSLLDDPRRCGAMAARARQAVESRFGLAPWLDRIESIYARCVEQRAARNAGDRGPKPRV